MRAPSIRPLLSLAFVALAVAFGALIVSGVLTSASGFRGWIADVRDADGPRGWGHLSTGLQREYDEEIEAYLADVAAADWSQLRLGPARDVRNYDGFVRVEAPLLSSPATVPRFLFDRGIVHGICEGTEPVAIGAFEDRRPFAGNRIDVSGETGTQARCNDAFHE